MEESKPADPARLAPSPFDSPEKADVILRTSDDVHFHVYQALLIIASQFFYNLLKDGAIDYHDNLPLYQVSESSSTMTVVFRLCYPINIDVVDLFDSGDLDERVLSALDKYTMDGPRARLRELISTSDTAIKRPLPTYGLALRLGCDNVARAAARRLLELGPLVELPLESGELKMISAYELSLLLKYCHACGLAAARVIKIEASTLKAGKALSKASFSIWPSGSCSACSDACDLKIITLKPSIPRLHSAHDWFRSFLDDVAPMLRDNPRKKLSIDFIDNALFRVNPKCPSQTMTGIKAVLQALDEDIQSAVDKVSLQVGIKVLLTLDEYLASL
ncbi:hypothetical protein CPB85DRAFT_1348989 [Mucidula mucida]|nr:hypothetical protein CPB85DRAFT_1348989 [Mucidula mucida]